MFYVLKSKNQQDIKIVSKLKRKKKIAKWTKSEMSEGYNYRQWKNRKNHKAILLKPVLIKMETPKKWINFSINMSNQI